MTVFRLRTVRGPLRAALTGFLLTAGIGFLVAILEVHAAMGGLAPDAIATTIRGEDLANKPDAAAGPAAEFAEEFGEDFAAGDSDGLRFGKGYRDMLQTAHTHTFAIPMLFLALTAIFAGSDMRDAAKSAVIVASFLIAALDLGGLWLTRYLDARFAYLNLATGVLMSACAAVLILRSLWDLWRPAPPRA